MSKLEKGTHICLILVCGVSLYVLLENRLFPPPPDGQPTEAAIVGHTEPDVPETEWKDSKQNVVLLISSKCHFCTESMPLYQKLQAFSRQGPHGISLQAASFEPRETVRDYLGSHNIVVDKIFQLKSGFAGVTVTPVIFVVDSHGVIRKAFVGKLSWFREQQLMSALKVASQ